MAGNKLYDIIIVGGSYAGLAAAMALGRALRKVLVLDSGYPCNRQTPYSHNFLTHDGERPAEIALKAKQQVLAYDTVTFENDIAIKGFISKEHFTIETAGGNAYSSRKLIFATGIRDIMPDIPGVSECWGISFLHCPYCHGYEVKSKKTGILASGDSGFEQAMLIANWTDDLTLYTNGPTNLSSLQTLALRSHNIQIIQTKISELQHTDGQLKQVIFKDGTLAEIDVIYSRRPFTQHCPIPESLGCELTPDGYLKIDTTFKTTAPGVYACGDNASRMRTVANAVAMGTGTGIAVNKELIEEDFKISY